MVNWIMQYGQIVAFLAQILYWIVIAAVAIWATLLFKRLVDFRFGVKPEKAEEEPAEGDDTDVFAD